MAVTKKEDNNTGKKELEKKDAGKKASARKDLAAGKDRKDVARKDTGKKEAAAKKDKVNRVEQAQKFFRGALNELKKVHWPTRRETTIYTSVVLVAVVAVGILIWIFDSALSSVLKLILQR
ncbi:MAG: preprotein translocase subunit SecE [Peptococcaceae bacterium]|nr:preprotein translocase subunit SecE [Peptococcaceae bacterium]